MELPHEEAALKERLAAALSAHGGNISAVAREARRSSTSVHRRAVEVMFPNDDVVQRFNLLRSCWCLAIALLLVGVLNGCAFRHLVGTPVQAGRHAQDRAILSNLRTYGRDGDWLVVRSYTTAGDAITALTDMPVSHAAVLDLTHDQVIEADAQGVHSTKLEKFVDESHRVLLLRPRWSDRKTGREAAATATGLIGKAYDFEGLVGANDPDKYYCSELALAAWRRHIGDELEVPAVVAPGQLYFWARVLWDSGPQRGE